MSRARPFFGLLARANERVSSGHLRQAGLLMLGGVAPGGAIASMRSAFDETATKYDREAVSAKRLAYLGTFLTIVLVLLAFSVALRRATRLAAEKHRLLEMSLEDALTDSLTGLSNRRKLFVDIELLLAEQRTGETLALGMFDLDGFKAYNDAFGHPAGDALLARLGQKLNAAIAGSGRAYRIGGDEFCVIARGDGAEALLVLAQEALSERNEGYAVRCGLGSVALVPEVTLEGALHVADQRLYVNKAETRADEGQRAPSVLVPWRLAPASALRS
jgi:diguanylate cyclase (GGDEF)-like protein